MNRKETKWPQVNCTKKYALSRDENITAIILNITYTRTNEPSKKNWNERVCPLNYRFVFICRGRRNNPCIEHLKFLVCEMIQPQNIDIFTLDGTVFNMHLNKLSQLSILFVQTTKYTHDPFQDIYHQCRLGCGFDEIVVKNKFCPHWRTFCHSCLYNMG